MTPDEREVVRQQLHKIDLLLRQMSRKCAAILEQATLMQAIGRSIEEEKKVIYKLLDETGNVGVNQNDLHDSDFGRITGSQRS